MTSIDKDGYPRTITMPIFKKEGIKKAWFVTWGSSDKVTNFRNNSKAGICVSDLTNGDNTTLTGNMEIITDWEVKKQFWDGLLIGYFPEGYEDSNFCVLEFTTNVMRVKIDYEIEEVTL